VYLIGPGGGGHRDPIVGGRIVIVNDVNLQISKQGSTMPLSVRRKNIAHKKPQKIVLYLDFGSSPTLLTPSPQNLLGPYLNLAIKMGNRRR
jgi:hypothetical protein